jgi:hypothetical protein
MNSKFSLETTLEQLYGSKTIQKIFVVLLLLGMAVCFVFILPPVQDKLITIMQSHIHRETPINSFTERLYSLFTLPLIGFIFCVFALSGVFSKSIKNFFDDTKNEKSIILISGIIITILLIFTGGFSYVHGHQWLNGDHSAEMVLGKLLADENKLVASSWNYSTELRLVYQTIFTMPLFKILGDNNWALVRAIAIVLNMIVLITAYVYMTVQMKIRPKWIALTSILLIVPVSMEYWDIVIFGGYYVFFIAQVFICIGSFFTLLRPANTDSKTAFCVFSLFSLVLGIQGIRALMAIGIPLLITCIAAHFSGITANRKKPLFLGIYGFILSGIGFFCNNLLHFKYQFNSQDDTRFDVLSDTLLQKLSKCIYCLAEYFGLLQEQLLLSARGIFGVLAMFFTAALFIFAFKKVRSGNLITGFTSLFFISATAFNMFLLVVTDDSVTARYLIPSLVFYLPLCAMLFDWTEHTKTALKHIVVLSFIFLFVCGQAYLNFNDLSRSDSNTIRKGYIEYLETNNIMFGFAIDGPHVTTELTNGKIEGVNLHDKLHISQMLNKKSSFNPSNYPGKAYLLLTHREWEQYTDDGKPWTQYHPDYEDSNFIVLVFSSAEIMYAEVLEN